MELSIQRPWSLTHSVRYFHRISVLKTNYYPPGLISLRIVFVLVDAILALQSGTPALTISPGDCLIQILDELPTLGL